MKNTGFFPKVEKGIHSLVRVFSWVSSVIIAVMVLYVMSNVVARFLFHSPIPGTIEVVQLLSVLVVFTAVSFTENQRGHISIELVVSRFKRSVQAKIYGGMNFIAAVFYLVLGWRAVIMAWENIDPRVLKSFVLSIPFAPFIIVIAFGAVVLALECIIHIFRPLSSAEKHEGGSN